MSILASPRVLRALLWADAASCAATALLHLAATTALSSLLGIGPDLLVASGLVLLVFVAAAAWLARREPVPGAGVKLLVAGNWVWVLACVGLLLAGAAGTALGQAYLVIQAVAVAVLAELQWLALRRHPVRGWA
jgi:hypothetical protein